MTTKTAFTDDEWRTLVEAPTLAGMMLITASGGGTFRETFALARAYGEARAEHGASELLDAIVAEKPQFDRHRYKTEDELRTHGAEQLAAAVAILREKSPDDLPAYRQLVLDVARQVAEAHKEDGRTISPQEQAMLDEITAQLAGP